MGEFPPSRTDTPGAFSLSDGEGTTPSELTGPHKMPYIPYRPLHSDFTPPASPQPMSPYVEPKGRKGFGGARPKQPAKLQMESATTPAYERPIYSPSPSSSPPLPALPSPKFAPPRQRGPVPLRHAALSSPRHHGYQRAEQSVSSPKFGPTAMRHANGPTSDPRSIFNALGSNPVNPVNADSPTWDSSFEDPPGLPIQQRMRGMTSTSQPSFHPPLRSATSIPDYGPIRTGERSNLSGTYRPNRGGGGPNWSHNDHYPPRYFRGEEPRASYRSGWTNTSSTFLEQSGTERSSMATGRSSVMSDVAGSTYSGDLSTDTLATNLTPDEEDNHSTVEDLIDAYFEDESSEELTREDSDEPQEQSVSYSPNSKSEELLYHAMGHPSQHLLNTPIPEYITEEDVEHIRNDTPDSQPEIAISTPAEMYQPLSHRSEVQLDQNTGQPSPLQPSSQVKFSPTAPTPDKLQVQSYENAWQRSSEEIPRPASIVARNSVLGMQKAARRVSKKVIRPSLSRQASGDVLKMQEIHREISGLPLLPKNKSRLSRHDWNEIQAYSNRNSRGAANLLQNVIQEAETSPPKPSVALPEVDEDEAVPRRASTSVYDRRSHLFDLGNIALQSPCKAKATEAANSFPSPRTAPPTGFRKPLSSAERDRYGFKKANHNISLQEYDAWVGKYEEHISRRRNKWTQLMSKEKLSTSNPSKFPEPCDKVKRYARKGYPPEWRGAMWWFYSGGQYKIAQPEMAGLYPSLVERINQGELNRDDREAIERDLDRTFPDNIHFRPDATEDDPDGTLAGEAPLIRDLREVLSCFALNNPHIGYCQSLNFIAGLLLLFLKHNERAFVLLTIITQNHLPGAHARSLANTEVNVLMMLIRDYLPKVWASINDTDLINSGPGSKAHPDSKFQRQPTVALSCTSWFMSIFVGVLPIETVLRVWDAFLYEGPRALYRYALAIFKLGEGEIRKYRPGDGELFMAVQNLPRRCLNPNVLHDLAFVKKGFGSLTQNVIDQKRLFWREQTDRAKRSASHKQRPGILAVKGVSVSENDANRGGNNNMGGNMKRKASRRFLKKKNTGL